MLVAPAFGGGLVLGWFLRSFFTWRQLEFSKDHVRFLAGAVFGWGSPFGIPARHESENLSADIAFA